MNLTIKIISLVFVLFLVSSSARAASENSGFNAYVAAGPNFVFPTSVRVGWNRWELGLLTRNFMGLNKTFPISGSSVYAGFGLGISTAYQASLGLQASVGYHYEVFWGLGLRAEMLANADFGGGTMAHALVGVSYGF